MDSIESRLAAAQTEMDRVNALVAEAAAAGTPSTDDVKAAVKAIAETAQSLLQEVLATFDAA